MKDLDVALSHHAAIMLLERGIRAEWVVATVEEPDWAEQDSSDPELRHALRAIPERDGRVLRVIYNATTDPPRVVTAFFDRRARSSP